MENRKTRVVAVCFKKNKFKNKIRDSNFEKLL
jgi:hypothetical protein